MRKKFLLSLLTAFLALPSVARDFDYEYEGQTITYTVLDEEAKTVETKGSIMFGLPGNAVSGTLVLPSTPKDGDEEYTLTRIGQSSFMSCPDLTSVIIPNSVTEIDGNAFYECTGLISVVIPNSVIEIGDGTFMGCSALTSVTIPSSVTEIEIYAFYGCSGLIKSAYPSTLKNPFSTGTCIAYEPEGVVIENGVIYGANKTEISFVPIDFKGEFTIPESVISIGISGFEGCTELTSVTIPNSVTEIGASAFEGCTELTSVTIPNSVTEIGASAFEGCTELTSVTIPNSVTVIERETFSACGLTAIDIPNSVTKIGFYAFSNCIYLTSVTIPNSVTEIGNYAFSECWNLTSVTIPNSVTEIGSGAFQGCSGLSSVTIPDSVTEIGSGAFQGCGGLSSVTIPDSVTEIGSGAFAECYNITEVNYITIDPVNIVGHPYWIEIFSEETYANAILYVKPEALDKVKDCYPWRNFKNIEVKDFTSGIEDIVDTPADGIDLDTPMEIFTLDGKHIASSVDNLTPGIYIIRQGKTAKKIVVK